MKKREFNFKAILLLYIISIAISLALVKLLGADSSGAKIISSIITALVTFMVYRGLIVNRMGTTEDYIMQIKKINLNFVLINILIGIVSFLITLIGAGSFSIATFDAIQTDSIGQNFGGLMGTIIVCIILEIIFNLLVTYANFIVGDPRNESLGIGDTIKKVFTIGKELIGRTFKSMLLMLILPTVLFIFISTGILSSSIKNGSFDGIFGIGVIGVIYAIIMIYLFIRYTGVISDHYLNYVGDYEDIYDDYEDYNNNNSYTLTRSVEVDHSDVKKEAEYKEDADNVEENVDSLEEDRKED